MDLTIEQLELRVPEIVAAAVRDRHMLAEAWVCPAGADQAAAAMAPPPPEGAPWRPLRVGEPWGGDPASPPARLKWDIPADGGSTHWLRVPLDVPPAWRGRDVRLALIWQGRGFDQVESIVYLGGVALAGLDWGHRDVALPADSHAGATALIRSTVAFPQPFGGAELQLRDPAVARLGSAMGALLGAARALPADASGRHDILRLLGRAYAALDLREGYAAERFASSAAEALALLDGGLAELRAAPADPRAPRVVASGHGHLDLAWLWPLWRTRQKAAHTISNALHLMERYPDYHFSLSQPQVYAFLKQDDPELYARLKARVAEGRLEPVGMMWVEPDCNLPSGESLVRQLVHGARFFAREFPERYGHGGASQVVWLPDVFGYTAALPQLMRGCGVRAFVTTKLSWNQVNRMPADTFRWRGIDGSEVLAHFITASAAPVGHPGQLQRYTYGGPLAAPEVAGTWRHYRQQPLNRELLYLFGHGDGGGGPTEEMLDAGQALAGLPGLPDLRLGRAEAFFDGLYERVWGAPELPSWSGELYFEYHRGTYTSQAQVKRANREAELRYREAEWLSAWAWAEGAPSQQAALDAGWELILRNQFHDILPGSSIAAVYADSRAEYAEAERVGEAAWSAALTALAPSETDGPTVVNTLPWGRAEAARIPLGPDDAEAGDDAQVVEEAPGRRELLVRVSAPPYSYGPLVPAGPPARPPLAASRDVLESAELRLTLDERGEICSLYDKANGRELALPGAALNQLVAYEDRPLDWDAWDIDYFYAQKAYPVREIVGWELAEAGPLRATVAITRRLGRSTVRQRISLWRDSRRVDFATEVDWQERQTLLRALFPLNLNATTATCEIQFGAVERPTHRNTSWEQARFEVCAHRWADVGEGDYGVALLNDGKYGHSFEGGTVGISLLKAGTFPDPEADRGAHRFTYSLLPHAGDWRAAQVVRRAYELNAPLRVAPGGAPAAPRSFLSCDAEHVVVETVKAADDGDGLIVRLYEAHNRRGPATVAFCREVASAEEADLLERPLGALEVDGRSVRLAVRPFEVKTLRVRLA